MAYIDIVPAPGRVVVRWRGKTVVDTTNALELKEGSYPPVLYFPREDADMKLLASRNRSSGEAGPSSAIQTARPAQVKARADRPRPAARASGSTTALPGRS